MRRCGKINFRRLEPHQLLHREKCVAGAFNIKVAKHQHLLKLESDSETLVVVILAGVFGTTLLVPDAQTSGITNGGQGASLLFS